MSNAGLRNSDRFQQKTNLGQSVESYSRFVSIMKVLLPALAFILVIIVIVMPQLNDQLDSELSEEIFLDDGEADTLSLVNAKYFGTDSAGQRFSITASSAREVKGQEKQIKLNTPQADISLKDGTWLMVGADSGLYDRGKQVLNLEGKVSLFQDQGYEIHTDLATVFVQDGSGEGDKPVYTQGSFGQLESLGFKFKEKGKVFYFLGPAQLILNSKRGN